jgi:hypothetical protein
MLKKDVEKVREILMNEVDCKFTVKGITEYGRKKDGEYGKVAKVFRTSGSINKDGLVGAIYEENVLFGQGMNVTKWGPTCVSLYTFDMFGRKIVGKIKYANVRFIADKEFKGTTTIKKRELESVQYECKNPLKTLPGFLGTEKG